MTRLDSLKSLQSRIREATGADRELDALIAAALLGGEAQKIEMKANGVEWVRAVDDENFEIKVGRKRHVPVNYYTTDPDGIGACVGLMREVLPELEWGRSPEGDFWITKKISDDQYVGVTSPAPRLTNDCLTLLYAICAALIAEEETKLTEKAG